MLGGPSSYGPGGWRGTAFERLLPLRSSAPEGGETAVVVLLDRSGSTGEAAGASGTAALPVLVRAVGALADVAPADVRLAVLPFASRPDAAPLAPGWVRGGDPAARAAVVRAAGALAAQGGTDLDAALAAAADLATSSGARRRRVLVVTDGDPDHALDATSFPRAREALARAERRGVRGRARRRARGRRPAHAHGRRRRRGGGRRRDRAARGAARRVPPRAGPRRAHARHVPRRRVRGGRGRRGARAARADRAAPARGVPRRAAARGRVRAGPAPAPVRGRARARRGPGRRARVGPRPRGRRGGRRRAPRARAVRRRVGGPRRPRARGRRGGGRLVVRTRAGLGALVARRGDPPREATLVEVEPGVYAGAPPAAADDEEPVEVSAAGFPSRPLALPARPPEEHRGAGTDDAALAAWAEAGGGRRLAPGERPRRAARASGGRSRPSSASPPS
ncbi:MAG: VWA domain-containing protein [Planctomycetota bacterium]